MVRENHPHVLIRFVIRVPINPNDQRLLRKTGVLAGKHKIALPAVLRGLAADEALRDGDERHPAKITNIVRGTADESIRRLSAGLYTLKGEINLEVEPLARRRLDQHERLRSHIRTTIDSIERNNRDALWGIRR